MTFAKLGNRKKHRAEHLSQTFLSMRYGRASGAATERSQMVSKNQACYRKS
jgi:hypothetical protein